MAKGIIYVMSTVVDGLIKIGKTSDFESRMSILESNGYRNVTGLKRRFAIELENYDEKESLLDDLFAKSRVGNTELFSLDVNQVIQLLSSFEGKIIYPQESKKEVFETATEAVQASVIPNGVYYIKMKNKKDNAEIHAEMEVSDGKFIVKKGSSIAKVTEKTNASWGKIRAVAQIEKGLLQEDVPCSSPSAAASVVVGHNQNGWLTWKDKNGNPIDIYRRADEEEEE